MVNIKDIAQKCGVTAATVSRALNGQKGVSEAMRLKIIETARDMGYRRHQLSASMLTSRSHMVGLIVPDITNPYYASIARGASSKLESKGYGLLICNTDRNPQTEARCIDMLCRAKVDGVLIVTVTAEESALRPFEEARIKVVAIDNPLTKKISCVMNDNYTGACDLVEHMVTNVGIKRLVAVMGYPDVYTTIQRLRATKDTLEKHKTPETLIRAMFIEPTFDGGYHAAPEILSLNPDSVFAINDTVAAGIITYCRSQGIRIPQDLKIAGYDDHPFAALIDPPLTTVHQRKYVLGAEAAKQLLFELEEPKAEPEVIELFQRLVVRSSLGEGAPSFSRHY